MVQWDLYIEHTPYSKEHCFYDKNLLPQFKQPNQASYSLFRELMQFIDVCFLDINSLQYKQRPLLAAFMYLTLGKYYKVFNVEEITNIFVNSSFFLLCNNEMFNGLFGNFLNFSFGYQLADLLPYIQYASSFFNLNLNFDLPISTTSNEKILEVSLFFYYYIMLPIKQKLNFSKKISFFPFPCFIRIFYLKFFF